MEKLIFISLLRYPHIETTFETSSFSLFLLTGPSRLPSPVFLSHLSLRSPLPHVYFSLFASSTSSPPLDLRRKPARGVACGGGDEDIGRDGRSSRVVDPAAPPSRGLDPTPLAPEWVTAELEGGGSGSAALRRGGSAILSPGQQQADLEGSGSGSAALGIERGDGDDRDRGQQIRGHCPWSPEGRWRWWCSRAAYPAAPPSAVGGVTTVGVGMRARVLGFCFFIFILFKVIDWLN